MLNLAVQYTYAMPGSNIPIAHPFKVYKICPI